VTVILSFAHTRSSLDEARSGSPGGPGRAGADESFLPRRPGV